MNDFGIRVRLSFDVPVSPDSTGIIGFQAEPIPRAVRRAAHADRGPHRGRQALQCATMTLSHPRKLGIAAIVADQAGERRAAGRLPDDHAPGL